MKKINLLFLVLLFSFSGEILYCQKLFRDGYIVKKNGESINGRIEYSANQNAPYICTFKRFDIARVIKYSPNDITAFGYNNGNRYESKELNNKVSFYEVIVTGKIILYSRNSSFYVDKDSLGLVEVKNGSTSYPANDNGTEFENLPEFLRFITEGKVGNISDKFNIKKDIIKLITDYNKASGSNFYVFNRTMAEKQMNIEVQQSGSNKKRLGVIAGVNSYGLTLTPKTNNYVPKPEKETCLTAGITYERVLSRKSDKLSLRLDVLLNKQIFYCYNETQNSLSVFSRDDAFFNFTGVKFPVLLQYAITGKRIVPYINGGGACQLLINSDYRHINELEDLPFKSVFINEDRNLKFKSKEITAICGLGARTRIFNNYNLFIEVRAEAGSGLFDKTYENITLFKQKSFQPSFLLGITF